MKTFAVALFGIVFSSAAIALDLKASVPAGDNLSILFLLVVGIVCLVIARRKST